jgi:hypothetical protein
MLRLLLKLAIAALIANAAWRAGSTYVTFYRFKDAVTDAAQYSKGKSENEVRQRVLALASDYNVPLAEAALTVRRQDIHTLVKASYTQPVDLFPGFRYQWPFTIDIDTFTVIPIKPGDLTNPQ